MKLAAFRELLARRVVGVDVLPALIKTLPDDILEHAVHEALNKMGIKGAAANHAIAVAAGHALPNVADDHPHESMDAALLHDSLSHHLSHYKAALKADDRSTADQHLSQIMKTINYGAKLHHNTGGKITLASGSKTTTKGEPSIISSGPWEMNYTGSLKRTDGKPGYHEGLQNWKRQQAKDPNSKVPDYRYMEMVPHIHHKESNGEHQNSAYPFHDLMVNGRYVDIGDIESAGKFVPHVFDSHPAVQHAYTFSPEMNNDETKHQQFIQDYKKWHQSPELEDWLTKQEESYHPDRGNTRSAPVLERGGENPHHDVYGRRPEGINFKRRVSSVADESTADALRRIRGQAPAAQPEKPSMFTMDLNEPSPEQAPAQSGPSEDLMAELRRIRGK